jgi:hypothetical protein
MEYGDDESNRSTLKKKNQTSISLLIYSYFTINLHNKIINLLLGLRVNWYFLLGKIVNSRFIGYLGLFTFLLRSIFKKKKLFQNYYFTMHCFPTLYIYIYIKQPGHIYVALIKQHITNQSDRERYNTK